MGYNLQKLKTIVCYDTVTIRIPERWDVFPGDNEGDSWCCCEEEVETGTLWITPNDFRLPEDSGAITDERFREMVGSIADLSNPRYEADLENSLVKVGNEYLWKRVHDGEEDGEPLRYFGYYRFQTEGYQFAFNHFNFVIPNSLLGIPEFQELIEIIDTEVCAAAIEPFEDGARP